MTCIFNSGNVLQGCIHKDHMLNSLIAARKTLHEGTSPIKVTVQLSNPSPVTVPIISMLPELESSFDVDQSDGSSEFDPLEAVQVVSGSYAPQPTLGLVSGLSVPVQAASSQSHASPSHVSLSYISAGLTTPAQENSNHLVRSTQATGLSEIHAPAVSAPRTRRSQPGAARSSSAPRGAAQAAQANPATRMSRTVSAGSSASAAGVGVDCRRPATTESSGPGFPHLPILTETLHASQLQIQESVQ
ncbi:hypothetical protein PHLGIDRAFT_17043, partial [Phlebiopsis gigantea 11061_1 CR5-6]